MSRPAPFAYGHRGRLLSSTHEHEVFTCAADDEAPLFIHALDAEVAGVRHVAEGVLALDELGQLSLLSVPAGERVWSTSTGAVPVALAATDAGRWAVVHAGGAMLGQGAQTEGSLEAAEVVAGAFGEGDTKLALVSSSGALIVAGADGSGARRLELGVVANGVAWSSLGWWLVSTEVGVFRWAPGEAEATLYLKWGGDGAPQRVVVSADGRLCAFVSEEQYVVVFGVAQDINGGAIVYYERTAGELEFGPGNSLGVGLGLGDGNKIDLVSGDVCRTDPPPDRARNRWMVKVGLDFDDIRRALSVGAEHAASMGAEPTAAPGQASAGATRAAASEVSEAREMGLFAFLLIAIGIGCLLMALVGVINTAFDLGLVLSVSGADTEVPDSYEVCAGLAAFGVLLLGLTAFGRVVAAKFRAAKGKPLVRAGILIGAALLLVVAGRGLQVAALVNTYGSMLAYYATDGDLDDVARELDKGATPEELDAAVGRAAQYDNHASLKLLLEAGADLRDASAPEDRRMCALGGTGPQFVRVALEHGVGPDSCPDSASLIWSAVSNQDDASAAELVELLAVAGWSTTARPEFSQQSPLELAEARGMTQTVAALEQHGASR